MNLVLTLHPLLRSVAWSIEYFARDEGVRVAVAAGLMQVDLDPGRLPKADPDLALYRSQLF